MAYKILILGASYGSLLGTKFAAAGHDVTLVCRDETAALINAEGTEVRIKLRDEDSHRSFFSKDLVGKVDAIYLPTDNTVISALEGIIKIAEQADIPVIAADTDSVKRGAIAALGFDYYDVGRQTGRMVVEVLNGKAPGDMPVQGIDKTELYVNPQAAKNMGIELSAELIAQAKEIIE